MLTSSNSQTGSSAGHKSGWSHHECSCSVLSTVLSASSVIRKTTTTWNAVLNDNEMVFQQQSRIQPDSSHGLQYCNCHCLFRDVEDRDVVHHIAHSPLNARIVAAIRRLVSKSKLRYKIGPTKLYRSCSRSLVGVLVKLFLSSIVESSSEQDWKLELLCDCNENTTTKLHNRLCVNVM